MIGNMQIDARQQNSNWEDKAYEKTLGRHGNIFRIMVQAALQRAVARGQKKIIFQAGYANEITQRRSDAVGNWGRELITAENLAVQQKNYVHWQKQFTQIKPGDLIYRPRSPNSSGSLKCVVIKSTPRKFSYYQERYEPLLLVVYDLPRHEKFRPGITLAAAKKDLVKTLDLGVGRRVKENGRGHFQGLI